LFHRSIVRQPTSIEYRLEPRIYFRVLQKDRRFYLIGARASAQKTFCALFATFANSFFSTSYFSLIQSPSQISSRIAMHQLT